MTLRILLDFYIIFFFIAFVSYLLNGPTLIKFGDE